MQKEANSDGGRKRHTSEQQDQLLLHLGDQTLKMIRPIAVVNLLHLYGKQIGKDISDPIESPMPVPVNLEKAVTHPL